jgi:hypothetical protein
MSRPVDREARALEWNSLEERGYVAVPAPLPDHAAKPRHSYGARPRWGQKTTCRIGTEYGADSDIGYSGNSAMAM